MLAAFRPLASAGTLFVGASSLVLLVISAAAAQAGTTDLRSLPGNFRQNYFATNFYAQSVIADDLYLNEARVLVEADAPGDDIPFYFLITGDRPHNGPDSLGFAPDLLDIRYSSGLLTAPAGQPLTEYAITPNIPVTPGERLFIVLDSYTPPNDGAGGVLATDFDAAVDPYPAGEFVYYEGAFETSYAQVNAADWQGRSAHNEDLAFLATFSAVPEPAGAVSLFALAAAGLTRRRHGSDPTRP